MLTFLVENVGKSGGGAGSVRLPTVDAFEYDRDFVAGIAELSLDSYLNLSPGGKTRGTVTFEIPKNAQVHWVRFDPNPFAKGDIYFE